MPKLTTDLSVTPIIYARLVKIRKFAHKEFFTVEISICGRLFVGECAYRKEDILKDYKISEQQFEYFLTKTK